MHPLKQLVSGLLLASSSIAFADQGGFMLFQNNASALHNRNVDIYFDAVNEDCMDGISNNLQTDTIYYIETDSSGWCFFDDDSHFDLEVKVGGNVIAKYSFEMDSEDTLDYWTRSQSNDKYYHHGEFATGGLSFFGVINSQDRMMISATEKSAVKGWMGQIYASIKDQPLNRLVLPGSHDSGTSDLGANIAPDLESSEWIAVLNGTGVGQIGGAVIKQLGVTQNYQIREQLDRGIRYLDIRLCQEITQAKACHGTISLNQTIEKILSDVRDFLQAPGNEQEVVIVDVQATHTLDNFPIDMKAKVRESAQNLLGNLVASPGSFNPDTPFAQFVQQGKRAIILQDDAYSDWVWNRNDSICTFWPDSDNGDTVWNYFVDKINNRQANCANDKFIQSQLIGTIKGLNFSELTLSLNDFNAPIKMNLLTKLHQNADQSWMLNNANIIIEDFTSGFDLALFAMDANRTKQPQPKNHADIGGGYHHIRSMLGAKCLDTGGSTNSGTVTHLWDCQLDNNNQPWRLDKDGYIRAAANPNKCLDPRGPSTSNGTVLHMWDCLDNYDWQQWVVYPDDSIRSKRDPGKCIDVENSNTNNGSKIQLWDCNGTNAQKWLFFGQIKTAMGTNKCLDSSGSTANGQATHMWQCDANNSNQPWAFDQQGRIHAFNNTGACLDPRGPSTANGTIIQNWDCQEGYGFHLWVRYSDGTIRPENNQNQCMDVGWSNENNGAVIHLWQCHGQSNQRWQW